MPLKHPPLRPYQKRATAFLKKNDGGAVFLRPGAGKSAAVCKWVSGVLRKDKGSKFLLVSMLSVIYDAWQHEPAKWATNIKVRNIHKDGYADDGSNFYVLNPERFVKAIKTNEPWIRKFNGFIIDESTIIKNYYAPKKDKKTGQTKFHRTYYFLRFLDVVKPTYRAIITGTPVERHLMDLWSQMYVVDKKLLGSDFWRFRSIFFEPAPDGYGWLTRDGAQEEILKRISIKTFTITKAEEDKIGYPKEIENDIYFTLSEKSMKKYKQLEKDFLIDLDNILVDKSKHKGKLWGNAVSYTYLSQFTSGAVYHKKEDERVSKAEYIHEERLTVLRDLLQVLDGAPLLVLYHNNFDITYFKKLKIKKARYLKDASSAAEAQNILDEWNTGKLTVLFAQISKASHGLNLQFGGRDICYYNVPHDYGLVYQSRHRLVRPGQKSDSVTIHRIICRRTVDEIKRLQILRNKTLKAEEVKNLLLEFAS